MRYTLLLIVLLTGCVSYVGTDHPQPVSPIPVYPPLYDVRPVKNALIQAQNEVIGLDQFVSNNSSMFRLKCLIDAYKLAAEDLAYAIDNTTNAQINYHPWRVQ